jgi:glycosyltransferase involved in cell wall biosynthesis
MEMGGAERVLSMLANHWVSHGYEITLLLLTADKKSVYPLDNRIRINTLGVMSASTGLFGASVSNVKRIRKLRSATLGTEPDIVLAFMTETAVLSLLAMRGTGIPVLACEHSDPYCDPPSRVWRAMRKVVFRLATRVILLSEHARDYFTGSVRARSVVIPNPVTAFDSKRAPEKIVLSMGRLARVKRYDRLIDAFANISARHATWRLIILGEGDERGALEGQLQELGLSGRVDLPGMVKDTEPYLSRAGIYVLCSDYEGFPMALCEAMAAGIPSVSVRYNKGIDDIIQNEINGLTVPAQSTQALSEAIDSLIMNEQQRHRIGEAARVRMQDYSMDSIARKWNDIFMDVLTTHPAQ